MREDARDAPPSRVLVLFAVEQELAPMRRRRNSLGDADLWLAATGMGARCAAATAAPMLDDPRPALVVIAGVAGALDPKLQVGDLVIADQVITETEVLTPSLIPSLSHTPTPPHSHTGPIVSLDQVLITAEEKAAAFAGRLPHPPTPPHPHTPPLAVEMETAAVARLAEARRIPWCAIRAVSDTAAESLPLDFNRLRDRSGDLPTSRVALAAITNPRAIPGLIRLGKNTSLAADRLAEALCAWIASGYPAQS
jgi:adenosylhomocysteine nucleosidase